MKMGRVVWMRALQKNKSRPERSLGRRIFSRVKEKVAAAATVVMLAGSAYGAEGKEIHEDYLPSWDDAPVARKLYEKDEKYTPPIFFGRERPRIHLLESGKPKINNKALVMAMSDNKLSWHLGDDVRYGFTFGIGVIAISTKLEKSTRQNSGYSKGHGLITEVGPYLDIGRILGSSVGIEFFGTVGARMLKISQFNQYNPHERYDAEAPNYYLGHYGVAIRNPENSYRRGIVRFEGLELGAIGEPSNVIAKMAISGSWVGEMREHSFLMFLSPEYSRLLGKDAVGCDFVPFAYVHSEIEGLSSIQAGVLYEAGLEDMSHTLAPHADLKYVFMFGDGIGERKAMTLSFGAGYSHSFGAPEQELMPSRPFVKLKIITEF